MTLDTVAASPTPEGEAAARRRLTSETEAATEALHEAAIYFEAGHSLKFTGAQVAAILAERIARLDEAYLADIATPPYPRRPDCYPVYCEAHQPCPRHAQAKDTE